MKHLTTLCALLLSCTMLAQGPVEFPWNPDSDGDDFIGVNDLMALLGEFDSVFSEEGLYLSEDSLSAMYFAGTHVYMNCLKTCADLPGRWQMPRLEDVHIAPQEMWLRTNQDELYFTQSRHQAKYVLNGAGEIASGWTNASLNCFCVTKERPKVEYSYCDGEDPSDMAFTLCINEKLAAGWYPLSGFPMEHSVQAASGGSVIYHDARTHASFWRWAE